MAWPKGQPTEHLRVWNKEQEEYVRQNYDGKGSQLKKVLPFTASAIRNKAKRLGIVNNGHFHHVSKTMLPEISEMNLNYIAGFIDGEGSIYQSTVYQYKVQVANSDEMVIRWTHSIIGIGKVRVYQPRGKQHLQSFVLCIERQGDVWAFLEMIIPYLRIKKQKAIETLDILESKYGDILHQVCDVST